MRQTRAAEFSCILSLATTREYVLVNKNNLQFIAQGTGVVVRPPDLMPGQDLQIAALEAF